MADDIRTKHAFVWGDLNARNQPNAFSYGETWTHVTQPNAFSYGETWTHVTQPNAF